VQSESNVCDTAAEKRLVIVVCQRFVQAMHDDAENLATEYEHNKHGLQVTEAIYKPQTLTLTSLVHEKNRHECSFAWKHRQMSPNSATC
jgi:hypothetical protein